MRRILFICATPVAFGLDTPAEVGLGGIESTNIALAEALARRGWAVTLATRRIGTVVRDGIRNIPLEAAADCAADAIVTSNDDEAFVTLHIEYIVIYGTLCKVRGHRDKIQLDVS